MVVFSNVYVLPLCSIVSFVTVGVEFLYTILAFEVIAMSLFNVSALIIYVLLFETSLNFSLAEYTPSASVYTSFCITSSIYKLTEFSGKVTP